MARNRIKYILLLFCTIWIYLVFVDYSALVLLLAATIFPVILAVITFIFGRKITAQISFGSDSVTKGSTEKIKITIHNPTILPFIGAKLVLEFKNSYEGKTYQKVLWVNLPDRETSRYLLEVTPVCCGKVSASIRKFRLYDYVGLFSMKGKIKSSASAMIVPAIEQVQVELSEEKNEFIDDPIKYSDAEAGDDPSEVFDVREYRQGDKMQKIHWKLTAKKDDIFIKEFSMPIDAAAVIFPELAVKGEKNAASCADAIVEAVLLLSISLLEQKIFHFICWYDAQNETIRRQEISSEEEIWQAIYQILSGELYTGSRGMDLYEQERQNAEILLLYITAQQDRSPACRPCRVLRVCHEDMQNIPEYSEDILIRTGNVSADISGKKLDENIRGLE